MCVCPFDLCDNSDELHTDPSIKEGNTGSLDTSLTLASLETAVVAHRAEELKNEDGHSHHSQAHDEHHHPHCWTVGLFKKKQKTRLKSNQIISYNY